MALVRERIRDMRHRLDVVARELLHLHLFMAAILTREDWDWVDHASWSLAECTRKNASARQSAKFDRMSKKAQQMEETRTVTNLSETEFDDATLKVLSKGLNFATTPRNLPISGFISAVEQIAATLPPNVAEEVRRETCRALTNARPPKSNITAEERLALRKLREDSSIIILPADKGNSTVIMQRVDYDEKVCQLLEDPAYRTLESDPTDKVDKKTKALLKESGMPNKIIRQLRAKAPVPPRLYGLPKIHKEGVPLRPIVSNIGAPTYETAKHLKNLLSPYVGKCVHHIRNSEDFLQRLKQLHIADSDIMVSFDVVSLFTRVPLQDSLELIAEKFDGALLDLFRHTLTSTYFLYGGQYYEQTEGVAMGSPLSPVVANMFMERFEERALETATYKPTCFYRYVDDTFVIWPHGKDRLNGFLEHLNSCHPNIKFTMELEKNGQLPFLDVLVRRKADGSIGHSVYRKPTHTDLYLQATSCHHPAQKNGILKTLVHRARALSDQESLPTEIEHLKTVFYKNGYTKKQIEMALQPATTPQVPEAEQEEAKKTAYLPYAGSISARISRILRKHNIKCVFCPSSKIGDLVGNVKDDLGLRKPGIYSIPCQCGVSYIGQTTRTVDIRCKEHQRHTRLRQVTKSAIAEHCLELDHLMNYDDTKILAQTPRFWDSVIRESIEIKVTDNLMNRDTGYQLSRAWDPALELLKKQRGQLQHHTDRRTEGVDMQNDPQAQHQDNRTEDETSSSGQNGRGPQMEHQTEDTALRGGYEGRGPQREHPGPQLTHNSMSMLQNIAASGRGPQTERQNEDEMLKDVYEGCGPQREHPGPQLTHNSMSTLHNIAASGRGPQTERQTEDETLKDVSDGRGPRREHLGPQRTNNETSTPQEDTAIGRGPQRERPQPPVEGEGHRHIYWTRSTQKAVSGRT